MDLKKRLKRVDAHLISNRFIELHKELCQIANELGASTDEVDQHLSRYNFTNSSLGILDQERYVIEINRIRQGFQGIISQLKKSLAIQLTDEDQDNLFDEANMMLEKGDYKKAAYLFGQIILKDPFAVKAYVGRGVARVALNLKEEGMQDLSHAIYLNPFNKNAYLNRASLFLLNDETQAAKQDFESANRVSL